MEVKLRSAENFLLFSVWEKSDYGFPMSAPCQRKSVPQSDRHSDVLVPLIFGYHENMTV